MKTMINNNWLQKSVKVRDEGTVWALWNVHQSANVQTVAANREQHDEESSHFQMSLQHHRVAGTVYYMAQLISVWLSGYMSSMMKQQ